MFDWVFESYEWIGAGPIWRFILLAPTAIITYPFVIILIIKDLYDAFGIRKWK